MPDALVAADLDLALDVLGDLAPQVTLDLVGSVDELADLADLVLGEVADLRRRPRRPSPRTIWYARVGPMP